MTDWNRPPWWRDPCRPTDDDDKIVRGELMEILEKYLMLCGGTMTGPLTLAQDPTADLMAATKQYVDAALATAQSYADGLLDAINHPIDGSTAQANAYTDQQIAALRTYVDQQIGAKTLVLSNQITSLQNQVTQLSTQLTQLQQQITNLTNAIGTPPAGAKVPWMIIQPTPPPAQPSGTFWFADPSAYPGEGSALHQWVVTNNAWWNVHDGSNLPAGA